MIIDKRTEFADGLALTSAAATYNMTNVVDLTTARDIGSGQPVYLVISVDTAILAAGAGTIAFALVSDASGTIATDGSQTTHWSSGTIATSTDSAIAAGYTLVQALPQEGKVYEEFLGVQYTVATQALTAGAASAYLTIDPPKRAVYADAI